MAEATPKKLEECLTADGQSPFIEWFDKIRDARARARIQQQDIELAQRILE
jgi:putative component of toxin-antitoxin plasmid stabilization module